MRLEEAGGALPVPVSAFGPLHCLVLRQYDMVINGRCPEALELTDDLEAGVRGFGDQRTLAFVLQGRMYTMIGLGRLHEAEAAGEELLRLQREFHSDLGEAKVSADLAAVRIHLGRVDEGLRGLAWATALLERSPRRDQRYVAAMSSVTDAAKAAELYELADQAARICLDSGTLSRTDRVAAALQHAELLLEWGIRLRQLGDAEDARARIRRSAQLTRTVLDGVDGEEAPLARALLALALATLGDAEGAIKIASALILPTRAAGQFHEARLAHLAYGIALRDRGHFEDARRELIAACELAAPAGIRTAKLIFDFELAATESAAQTAAGGAPGSAISVLRGFARQLWRSRLERILMLRQARARAELEAERTRAYEAASRDPLTGLGNRRRFEQQMSALAESNGNHRPVSLVLVDADGFKAVNDGFSHAVGDEVLCQIADVVRANCRQDDVAVRFGGDEFAVFVSAELRTASLIGERVRRAVAERDWSDVAEELRVTLSIGVAELVRGMSPRDLFDAADRRLYDAKRGGRNRLAAA